MAKKIGKKLFFAILAMILVAIIALVMHFVSDNDTSEQEILSNSGNQKGSHLKWEYAGSDFEARLDEALCGPARSTYTMESPATYAVFNSITNNPTIGDERYFIQIGEICKDENIQLKHSMMLSPDRQYLVAIYIHNNASTTFNSSDYNYVGIATGVRLSVDVPENLHANDRSYVKATVISNNTEPSSVWAKIQLGADEALALRYVSGSAKIYNDWETNKQNLPSSLLTEEGAFVSLKKDAIGAIPGCEEYHSVITMVLETTQVSK